MGLSATLLSAGARRPHVLVVPVPGHAPVRRAAEDALDSLSWPRAASPAEVDVLVCCGPVGRELAPYVEVAWQAMPGPRVRTSLSATTEVHPALVATAADLASRAAHRDDAAARESPPLSAAAAGDMDMSDMDMSDMDMDLPGGLVMADRVEDRDGLRLEGLRLSWGPLLPAWPAGLRLDVVLSGDVLVQAKVHRLDPSPEPAEELRLRALDALALLLSAAGWDDGALAARRARTADGRTEHLLRRLDKARLLRWSLRQLPAPGGHDLVTHLDRLIAAARNEAKLDGVRDEELTTALVGLDVGTAHVVVAAYGPLLTVPVNV